MQKTLAHDKGSPPAVEGFIDLIKALAITSIFCYHVYDFRYLWGSVDARFQRGLVHDLFPQGMDSFTGLATGAVQVFFAYGSYGVDLFFIASGFGICLSWMRRSSWRQFYMKRVVRVLPLYWLAVIVVWLLEPGVHWRSMAYHMLLVQTFTGHYLDLGVLWFVGVIFVLYLVVPLLALLLGSLLARVLLLALSLAAHPVLRAALDVSRVEYNGIDPLYYLPMFAFGMLLAASYRESGRLVSFVLQRGTSLAAAAVLLVLVYLSGTGQLMVHRYLLSVLFFLAMYAPYRLVSGLPQAMGLVRQAALGSYIFFLFHLTAFRASMYAARKLGLLAYSMVDEVTVYYESTAQVVVVALIVYMAGMALSCRAQALYDGLAGRALSRLSGRGRVT